MPRSRFVLSTCLVSVLALVSLGAREAGAIQIVPSIGISQTPDGENRTMMAVALRNGFLPRTQMEFQAGYRTAQHGVGVNGRIAQRDGGRIGAVAAYRRTRVARNVGAAIPKHRRIAKRDSTGAH